MIPVAEARRRILEGLVPVAPESVPLLEACGRVLAVPVHARTRQPPADVSAMDGYAVRAEDVAKAPVELRVVAEVPAGRPHDGTIGPGEAARIFTGAPLPEGTDAIVIQEDTEDLGEGRVRFLSASPRGRHVRAAGIDFDAGDLLVPAGRTLTARDVGLAAAADHPWLPVRRRPRVALLATGDEIVQPGEPRGPGQIVSSNAFALAAAVRASGGEATDLGPVPDVPGRIREALDGVAGFDLLVTTGGVSIGTYDLVGSVLEERGLELSFWKVAMRPGKPLLFGRLPGGPPVLGFPGNPVSAVVCALVFLRPALRAMLGLSPEEGPEPARLGRDLPANDRREDYLRADLAPGEDGLPVATPFELQDSSVVSLLAAAECLVVRPPEAPAAKAGEPVQILRFPGGPAGF